MLSGMNKRGGGRWQVSSGLLRRMAGAAVVETAVHTRTVVAAIRGRANCRSIAALRHVQFLHAARQVCLRPWFQVALPISGHSTLFIPS